jgi:hypothetical protein
VRATTAIFDVFGFAGAGITSKKIETMPDNRKSNPTSAQDSHGSAISAASSSKLCS